jgi:hypothetical protein
MISYPPQARYAGNETLARKLSLAIFLFCCVLFLGQGVRGERAFWHSCDYVPLYAGARCMFTGCDPYSFPDIERQYYEHGGERVFPFNAQNQPLVNPPTTLLVVMPFSLFSFPIADMLWLAAGGVLFCYAAYATLTLAECAPSAVVLSCILLLTSPLLLMLGQSATMAIATMTIAIALLLRGKWPWLAVSLLAISIALKPHLVGLVLVYFLLQNRYRARALQAIAAIALLTVVSSLWVTVHPASRRWVTELKATLARSVAPGGIDDPSPANPDSSSMANLQVDASMLFPVGQMSTFSENRHMANLIAWTVTAILVIGWLFGVSRARPTLENDLLAIAGVCCISLLPVYHRLYDTRLLLLTIPALALLLKRHRLVGGAAACLTCLIVLSTNNLYAKLVRTIDLLIGRSSVIPVGRLAPLVVTLLAITYVVMYVFQNRNESDLPRSVSA